MYVYLCRQFLILHFFVFLFSLLFLHIPSIRFLLYSFLHFFISSHLSYFLRLFSFPVEEVNELNLLQNRIKMLMTSVALFRSNDLIIDENIDENNVKKKIKNKRYRENENQDEDNNENNQNGYIQNYEEIDGQNQDENDDENDNEENDENNSFIKIFCWNGNKDFHVSILPDLPLFPSNFISDDPELISEPIDDIFDSDERTVLTQIFLDVENASKLLGHEICSFLNENVQHEAVQYLQETAYKNIPCINFLVSGDSGPQILELNPPTLSLGGQMSIGRTYKGKYGVEDTACQLFIF